MYIRGFHLTYPEMHGIVHAIPRARVYTVQQLVLCATTKYRHVFVKTAKAFFLPCIYQYPVLHACTTMYWNTLLYAIRSGLWRRLSARLTRGDYTHTGYYDSSYSSVGYVFSEHF